MCRPSQPSKQPGSLRSTQYGSGSGPSNPQGFGRRTASRALSVGPRSATEGLDNEIIKNHRCQEKHTHEETMGEIASRPYPATGGGERRFWPMRPDSPSTAKNRSGEDMGISLEWKCVEAGKCGPVGSG